MQGLLTNTVLTILNEIKYIFDIKLTKLFFFLFLNPTNRATAIKVHTTTTKRIMSHHGNAAGIAAAHSDRIISPLSSTTQFPQTSIL